MTLDQIISKHQYSSVSRTFLAVWKEILSKILQRWGAMMEIGNEFKKTVIQSKQSKKERYRLKKAAA